VNRFYLTEGDGPEREVSKAEFVSVERRAGFVDTLGEHDEPATAGFGAATAGTEIRGRVAYEAAEPSWVLSIAETAVADARQHLMEEMTERGEDPSDTGLWRLRKAQLDALLQSGRVLAVRHGKAARQ
jgi:hypothetical protein